MMKRKLFVVLLLLFITFSAGCGEARLDGSTQSAFDKSLAAMRDGLKNDEDKSRLMGALLVIEGRYRLRRNLGLPQEGSATTFLEAIDGKSYDEVIELAGMKRR